MTVQSAITEKSYKPGAAMVPEALTGIVFHDPDELVVELQLDGSSLRTELTPGTHYTIAGDGPAGAGTITATGTYAADDLFHVRREALRLQKEHFPAHVPIASADLQRALDSAKLVDQDQDREIGRAIKVPRGEPGISLPAAADRAGKFLVGDVDGNLVPSVGTGSDAGLRVDLATGDGNLVAARAPDAPAVVSMESVVASRPVAIEDYRSALDTDDLAALARAIAAGRRNIHLPAGRGLALDGAYIFDTAVGVNTLVAGLTLSGDGEGSVIRSSDDFIIPIRMDSGGAAATIDNVTIRDLRLEGYVATDGFDEPVHLMHLNGVRDWLIENVSFVGFQGDGIYLGSGTGMGDERHNSNITIRSCKFDGVNNDNRNGISIIDGDNVTIEDCDFKNCTKLDGSMPGPIDCEPDANAFAIVRNIRILNNSFEDCGGAAVALLLRSQTVLDTPHENFLVSGNKITNCQRAFSFFGYTAAADLTAATKRYGVQFIANQVRGCLSEDYIILKGAFGLWMDRNTFEDCGFIGLGFDAVGSRQMFIERNAFTRCATGGSAIIIDANLNNSAIRFNHFFDCGKPDGTQGWIVYARAAAANITGLKLNTNKVETVTRTTAFARAVGGYAGTIDGDSSKGGNELPALGTADNLTFPGATVVYANDWVTFGGNRALKVTRDDLGRVYLNGAIKSGVTADGTTMFTLPVGYRPKIEEVVICYSNVAAASVIINPDGTVQVVAGVSATDLSFNCSFATV